MIIVLLKSMRPKQWIKNLFVFAGVIFSGNLFDFSKLLNSFLAFLIFCGLAGAIYIINDVKDIEQDRKHPKKSKRPLASGKLRISHALPVAVTLLVICLGSSFYLNWALGVTVLSYGILHIAYSLILKNVVIIDIFSVALGFVLRVVAGIAVVEAPYTPWILICTSLLALFISLGKRRGEIILLKENANEHRRILEEYSLQYLDYLTVIVATSTIMAYSLFTFTSGKNINLMLTIPFVLYGIFRYLYLIYVKHEGGAPEILVISDKPLLLNNFLWVVACIVILYIS